MMSTLQKRVKNTGLHTKYEVNTIDDDDTDVVSGVFVKADQVDNFSLSGEEIFPGKKCLIRAHMIKYLTRGDP